jgi:hypothetical protein
MTTLAKVLKDFSMGCEIAGNVALLELKNSPPENALLFLTPTTAGAGGYSRNNADLAKSFKNFMRYFVTIDAKGKSPLTGSCGQTSQWLDRITTKGGVGLDMATAPTSDILSQLAAVTANRWYCRYTCGSHSFLIEHVDGQYGVYQSFHGAESIQASVTNILNNLYVFRDKTLFFRSLRAALMDASSYQTSRDAEAVDNAIQASRKLGPAMTSARILELSNARITPNKEPERTLLANATANEKRVVDGYDAEIDEIMDEVMRSGTRQEEVFHGKQWKTVDPSQYRLNIDPAALSEIATNIKLGIQANLDKWAVCFQDTKSPMKARLKKLGIALGPTAG